MRRIPCKKRKETRSGINPYSISRIKIVICMVAILTAAFATQYSVEKFNFTGYSVNPYSVKYGAVSNSLYYSFELLTSNYTVVRKISSSNTLVWMTSISNDLSAKSLSVSSNESKVCFSSFKTIKVVCLNTNNGSVYSAIEHYNLNGGDPSTQVHLLPDGSGYYIVSQSSSKPHICKFLFSTPSSCQCQKISTFNTYAYGQLMLDSNNLVVSIVEVINWDKLYYYKVTFGTREVNWATRIGCQFSTACSSGLSEILVDSTNTYLYLFIPFTSINYLYFVTHDVSSGNQVGSFYISGMDCLFVNGSAQSGEYIIANVYCSGFKVAIFNKNLGEFSICSFSDKLFGAAYDIAKGMFVISGILNSTGYITKFPASTLILHPDFTGTRMRMEEFTTKVFGTTSMSGVTISSATTLYVRSFAVTSVSVSYNIASKTNVNSITTTSCGDGIMLNPSSEECDDANNISGDGCSNICKIEKLYECYIVSSNINISKCTLLCGNGVLNSPETCDDKNQINGDGCSKNCIVENGYECAPNPLNNNISKCTLLCGNGVINNPETCDDKNRRNADGCSSTCTIETGYECSADPSNNNISKCILINNNNGINNQNNCNDNNQVDGDGCSANNIIEAGYECAADPSNNNISICNLICSNGILNASEECDDKNTASGDGCSQDCTIETGYECAADPSNNNISKCNLKCSNGVLDASEECDDKNTASGDGCSQDCTIETGYECAADPSNNNISKCNLKCSNGVLDASEECDDKNTASGDGCSQDCTIETGYECAADPSNNNISKCNLKCSNGVLDASEECDDKNTASGDGCSQDCTIETGYECAADPSNNNISKCNLKCSNGVLDASEECDDKNTASGDGCSQDCTIETGYECAADPSNNNISKCNLKCSNGVLDASEECDDKNTASGDGCSQDCTIETGYECAADPSNNNISKCNLKCSNGVLDASEECDDKNTASGDGCSQDCTIETGYECAADPSNNNISKCNLKCSNGVLDASEECDDKNTASGDGCSQDCTIETGYECAADPSNNNISKCNLKCSNGVLDASEECDDNNIINGDGCNSYCKIETGYNCISDPSISNFSFCSFVCGNGILNDYEQCDDNNLKNGDGCNSLCIIESNYYCRQFNNISICSLQCINGKFDIGEQCDDGNISNGDGCSQNCIKQFGYICENFINKESFCYPVCGNSIQDIYSPFFEECDDGNNMDNDGCSSTCKIESNYVCSSSNIRDICVTKYLTPKIIKSSYDSSINRITIEFDQNMKKQELTYFDISIDANGINTPYSVLWNASFDKNILKINFTISPSFLGVENEVIKLQILNVLNFKSENEIPIDNTNTIIFNIPKLLPSGLIDSGASGTSYMLVLVMLLSIGINLVTGDSIELMWSLANTLQIMFYYGLMNLYFSPELLITFYYMRYSNFDNPAFEWIQNKLTSLFSSMLGAFPSGYEGFGYSTSSVLINLMSKMIMIILFLSFFAFIVIIYLCARKKTSKFANFIKRKEIDLRYEGLSRFFIEIILQISVFCFINLIYGNLNDIFDIISYSVSIILMLCIFYMLGYCFIYPIIYYSEICTHPDFHERHCLLFLEFNMEKQRNLLFYAFFILYRIFFAFFIIGIYDFPLIQCILVCLLNFWILIKTFKMYKDCLPNFLYTFNSAIQFFFSCCLPLFLNPNDPNKIKIAGYICIGILSFFFSVNLLLVIPQIVIQIYRKIKECCHTKTKEEIEKEMRSKTIIRVPALNQNNKQKRSNRSIQTITFRKYQNAKQESSNEVVERIICPNYYNQINASRDRRIEEQKIKSQFRRRNHLDNEWNKF